MDPGPVDKQSRQTHSASIPRGSMIRVLKGLCTMNIALSFLLYGGFIIYCLSQGIDISKRWGIIEHGRGGPTWALVAFLEAQLLMMFIWGQFYSDEPQTLRYRLGYFLWGVFILVFWLACAFHHAVAPPLDIHLIGYVAISDLAYGFIGSNDT